MSVVDLIQDVLGVDRASIQVKLFECRDCGETFESAKDPDRASCPECLANDVDPVGTVDDPA